MQSRAFLRANQDRRGTGRCPRQSGERNAAYRHATRGAARLHARRPGRRADSTQFKRVCAFELQFAASVLIPRTDPTQV